tara:strand:+ start:20 stop:1132 length:1113 start_codon:yes stop_codon:yes gene_type:complete
MHIVLLFTFDYSLETWANSGHLQRELRFYNLLVDNGFKVTFITYGDNADLNILKNSKIDVFPIYSSTNKSKYKIFNLLKSFYFPFLIKRNIFLKAGNTIIKQNQLLGSWVAIILKLITKSKLYMRTGYDMYLFSIKNKKSLLKRILYFTLTQKAIFFSDIYSVTSSSDLMFLESKFLNTKKIVKRPNWVDVDLSKNSFEENKILAVGRLENQKNFKELIDESVGTNFEINIYGEGSKKDDLINQARELNVKIKIFNNVENNELLDIYKKYKYFVSTANFEGNSKVILEAISRGCIVIAKDIENNREIIEHMKSGLLFTENLNEILKNCSENQYDDLNFTENAIEVIDKYFNFETIFSNYMDDFKLLLKTN